MKIERARAFLGQAPAWATRLSVAACAAVALVACASSMQSVSGGGAVASSAADQRINPLNWPQQAPAFARDAAVEARVRDLLARMSDEEKVGQLIQADIGSVTPDEVRRYHLGSVLNGGNGGPNGQERGPASDWLALADQFWIASTDTTGGRTAVPVMWGTDAVHGHNNIVGATIFPHNIGLGAARDPDLMERIGQVTAREIRVTGIDWTFAPTIAVARDDRWGRTYESFSETPDIVAAYAPRIVQGLQGHIGDADFLRGEHLMATVKHFVGDGGTHEGRDQGDNQMTEAQLRDLQAAGYMPAIRAGVQSVMASYNSFHGEKMHGYRAMLTDVLRGRMAFDGFVVGDWNGHGQVSGCTPTSCAASLNAGLDMFMAPDSWRELWNSTLAQVRDGTISRARLDEAVARILRSKIRAGLFEAGLPSRRPLAGQYNLLGSAEHRAVAREAVRRSLVLLKNEGSVLPIRPGARVLVTGPGADDLSMQSGGWTLSWQGTGNARSDFPGATSIWEGLRGAITEAGGSARLSAYGDTGAADVAIVVFGEEPYAEFQGDRTDLDYVPTEALDELRRLRRAGIPTVALFLSGRPLWVNPELNAADAFVAAWLPGSEGAGISDVLVAGRDGRARHDFTGRLSFSWPRSSHDYLLNHGDAAYDPLFAWGYGLSYARPGRVAQLPENTELAGRSRGDLSQLFVAGRPRQPWQLHAVDAQGARVLAEASGQSPGGTISLRAIDGAAQEDSRLIRFGGDGEVRLMTDRVDMSRQANGELTMRVIYRVDAVGNSNRLNIGGRCDGVVGCEQWLGVGEELRARVGRGWQTSHLRLSCFGDANLNLAMLTSPFILRGGAGDVVVLREVRLVENPGNARCTL